MKDKLFPDFPDELGGLSAEQIDERLAAHREVAKKIHSRDPEFFAEHEIEPTDAEALVEEFQAGVVQIHQFEAAQTELVAAEERMTETLDTLASEAGVLEPVVAKGDEDDDDGDDNGDDGDESGGTTTTTTTTESASEGAPAVGVDLESGDAVEVVEQGEPVMASLVPGHKGRDHSSTGKRVLRLPPAGPRAPQENTEDSTPARPQLVASAGVPGVNPGEPFEDRIELAKSLATAFDRAQVAPGFRQDVVVASARYDFPEDRILGAPGSSAESDTEKIMDICGPRAWGVDTQSGLKALLADGGICAAPTPFYDLPMISVADRPVRDGHPSFQAARGAVSVPGRLTLGDVTTAVGTVSAEDDAEGGTFSEKACQRIECDPYSDYQIVAHYACVEWGNFGARTWPERVATFADLVAAAHARMAETFLLDQIDSVSTQVGAAAATYGYGAVGNLLSQILVAADGMRSRHRASPNMRFRAILPFWARGMLVSDLRNSQFNRFDQSVAGVEALLEAHGVNVIWHLDTATGDGQIFGAQGAGALLPYPTDVKWWIYPEGSFLFLDGGTLDLGIVRDSTLNLTNDFQVFFETFEQMAWLGLESLAITSELCPSGATGGPDTLIDCGA